MRKLLMKKKEKLSIDKNHQEIIHQIEIIYHQSKQKQKKV